MDKKSIIEKLIENTPLAVILIGLILFLLSVNGGWTKADLKIDSATWRVALAAMGFVVFAVGVMFYVREKGRHNIGDDLKKKYGIKILTPDEGAEVGNPIEVSGTYDVKPPDGLVRVIEFSPRLNQYWPKNFISFDSKNKRWFAEVYIGGGHGGYFCQNRQKGIFQF